MTDATQTPRPGSLADRIVGSWELIDYRTTDDDGRVTYPLGEQALGQLIYSADGYMSAQIMRGGRSPFRTPNVHSGEPAERTEAAAGYLAYSGPYEVDEASARVRHLVTVSLYPNWLGSDQFRTARCEGDRLELSSDPLVFRTTTLYPALTWRRVSWPARAT